MMHTSRPNIVLIMTDTQTRAMVGAYGLAEPRTPHLDAFSRRATRHDQAYTTCPLCTPARSAIFSGVYPWVNGAWANNLAPGADVVLMGEIFARAGYRTAYTGKWHLDGGAYFGDGEPGGGFEPDWWYDGYRYAKDLGPEAFRAYTRSQDPQELARHGLDRSENLWGHRVADRAIDFLAQMDADEQFCLVVSFDEPHAPYRCPADWPGTDIMTGVPAPAAFGHVPTTEPSLHTAQRTGNGAASDQPWEQARERFAPLWRCNHWIDSQIGRVLDAIASRADDDTIIISTTDHGTQQLEHGLDGKGPMLYQDSIHIPLLVHMPGQTSGAVSDLPISHLDLLPTMMTLAGIPVPDCVQGVSQADQWCGSAVPARQAVHCGFTRFAINHDGWGGLQPIRSVIADGWKLVIHLQDEHDHLFHLATDPHELDNRIADPACASIPGPVA